MIDHNNIKCFVHLLRNEEKCLAFCYCLSIAALLFNSTELVIFLIHSASFFHPASPGTRICLVFRDESKSRRENVPF